MKEMIALVTAGMFAIFLGSCKPETPPSPFFNNSPIIWKKEREYKRLASNNYIYKNLLLQGTDSYNGEFKVVALTLDSGKLVWETNNLSNGSNFNPFDIEDAYIQDNRLILSQGSMTYVIDIETGNILWQDLLDKGYNNICVIDGYIYKTTQTKSESEMYRYNLSNGQREKLFSLTKSEHGEGYYGPVLRMPVKWADPQGNEVLIMSNRSYDGANNRERMDVLAWNLTADSMLWYRRGVDERGSSSRPVIEDNRVYFYGMFQAFCLDAQTGNTIWTFENNPNDNFGGYKTANILLIKDKVILKPDSYWMYAVDKITGKQIWAVENVAPMPGILREHMDTIWFSSGGVYAIDANTGRKLIDGWDNNGQGPFWSNPVVHHPTLGYIYTTDGDHIYCLDPRRMK